MKFSTQVGQIAKAMAAAQSEMQNPKFDAANPHFRSKFASLSAVRDAVVPVFAKHGVSLTQDLSSAEGGIGCTTILMHESGEWIAYGPLVMPYQKDDAQGRGSAGTYCKRYAMQAVAAVVGDEDDDAEAAQGGKASEPVDELTAKQRGYAREFGEKFRAILKADRPEDEVVAEVYALHLEATEDQAVYAAAANFLDSKERASWKRCVSIGNKQQRAA